MTSKGPFQLNNSMTHWNAGDSVRSYLLPTYTQQRHTNTGDSPNHKGTSSQWTPAWGLVFLPRMEDVVAAFLFAASARSKTKRIFQRCEDTYRTDRAGHTDFHGQVNSTCTQHLHSSLAQTLSFGNCDRFRAASQITLVGTRKKYSIYS